MSLIPTPMDTLTSLQQALDDGMPVDPSELDAGYKTFFNEPNGNKRYIYAKIIEGEAQVLSLFGISDVIDGLTCYNVSYAVKENHRGHGLAVEAVNKGIEKLKKEYSHEQQSFYIEAVIDIKNLHSIRVAEKLFSESGVAINDSLTGVPSLYFKKLIVIP